MNKQNKTVLSFYCDDTNPYNAPPSAFETFLDFVSGEGVSGEASAILGYGWADYGLISHPTSDDQVAFAEQLRRAYACGLDSQFELMTHWGLFDFEQGIIPEGAQHEGVWMFEPAMTIQAYEAYFENILAEGERIGIHFTGLTQPGCSCEACTRRFRELGVTDHNQPNPNVWQALLNLAQRGRFRSQTVPCFFGGELENGKARLTARSGSYGVFDFQPNARDRLGSWDNLRHEVDVDYYISSDGKSGRIVDLVRREAPYCLFYCHWQGLNPANGVGWKAFKKVVARVKKHLRNEVVWMRPSEYTDTCL